MTQTKLFAALALSLIATAPSAKPIELDTADAHIVVVRTIDGYGTGDTAQDEGLLEYHATKKYSFAYVAKSAEDKKSFVTYTEEKPVPVAVKAKAAQSGFSPRPTDDTAFKNVFKANSITLPVTLSPSEANQFTDVQNKLWGQEVLKLGDPDTLAERFKEEKDSNHWGDLAKGVLGAVGGGVAGHFLGTTVGAGAGGLINTTSGATIGMLFGLSPEESQFVPTHKDLVVFARLPKVDYTKYKTVDVRKVVSPGQFARYGDIIIAYKGDKTEQAEQEALIAAIPVLLGFNESVDQIKAARTEELAARKALWSKYVAEQAVKKE